MTASSKTVNWGKIVPRLVSGGIILAILGGVGFMIYSASDPMPLTVPQFHLSQMVRMKAFGNEGMVVRVGCGGFGRSFCTYDVRFSAMQLHTNVALFGTDGPVDFAPVALVRGIREFELEPS